MRSCQVEETEKQKDYKTLNFNSLTNITKCVLDLAYYMLIVACFTN